MANLDVLPLPFELFGHQTSMTVVRLLFAAEQAAPVQHLPRNCFLDTPAKGGRAVSRQIRFEAKMV